MAKIKLIVRKMSFLAIACSFLLISCNRNNEIHNDEIKTIKIAVSEGQKNYFTMLIDRFEELYSNKYKIEVKVFENNSIINYYLSHDYLDVDIVAFDNLNTANSYGEYLQTLNRFDAIGNYQSSISDYLRTSSGKINVIPGQVIYIHIVIIQIYLLKEILKFQPLFLNWQKQLKEWGHMIILV